jgi:hypothetical protein
MVGSDTGEVHWDWNRVANAIDMKNDRTSQFLARNREQHVSEMMAAEINASQIQYKGWESNSRGDHAVGNSA